MPTIEIPVTVYRISEYKPGKRYGTPEILPFGPATTHRGLVKVPIDRIPEDASVTDAQLQFFAARDVASGKNWQVRDATQSWKASDTWATQPTVGSVLDSATTAATAAGLPLPPLDVTAWVNTRSRKGLRVESTSAAPAWHAFGSSASDGQPYLSVTYTVQADPPSNMRPDGGAVSVDLPILTYAGDPDITAQKIQYSSTGDAGDIDFDSGWLSATEGRFDPAGVVGVPVVSDGATGGIWWRAQTDGPGGPSPFGEWAFYWYRSLPDVVIINPPATTDDGDPPLTWTVEDDRQTSWAANLKSGTTLIDKHDWDNSDVERDWLPGGAVQVPGGSGQFTLWVKDDVAADRVAADGAPTEVRVTADFTTVMSGAGAPVDTVVVTYDDPVPVITGTRSLGTPDEVGLERDGILVPIWGPDGTAYQTWAPGTEFFAGTDFEIRDYTASPRTTPVYSIRVRSGGVVSDDGPTDSMTLFTPSVWLVNPRTGEQIDIQGINQRPVVEQETGENSVLHVPINGGLVVEPKRRRIIRTTKFGSIEGAVLNENEALLEEWALADSSLKYCLIFGKVNWSVIIGDYNPQDQFYDNECGDDYIALTLNWWQRLTRG
jgi:hypothetical protein